MNQELLKEELIRYEGIEHKVYLDTLGLKTAGIGHLLTGPERDMAVGTAVSDKQIEEWYAKDIPRSIHIARNVVKNYDQLDQVRQRVLVQLAFNMGNRLAGFKKAIAAIESCDFKRAADELQDSKWFTQVGRRGPETCYAMRTGSYGWRKWNSRDKNSPVSIVT